MNPFMLFWVTLAVSTAVLITWKALDSRADPQELSIQNRANQIFAYDKHQSGRLSFNQLAALSVALEFKDYQGADILVTSLERQIHSQ